MGLMMDMQMLGMSGMMPKVVGTREFEHAGTTCVLKECVGPMGGYWCGYVRVPEGHPDFGVDYGDVAFPFDYDMACGEVTFTDELCDRGGWWIGFDTAHYGDDTSEGYAVATAKALAEVVMGRMR